MNAVVSLSNDVGIRTACSALDVPRAGFYRWRTPKEKVIRPVPPLALSCAERGSVLDLLHSDRFVDKAPQEIYATLLDEKEYVCSVRTMYRILAQENELKERKKAGMPSPLCEARIACHWSQRGMELGYQCAMNVPHFRI